MTRLKESIFINAPVDKVDDLVRDPHRWTAFFVGAGEPEKVTGDGGTGTVVEESGTLVSSESDYALPWSVLGQAADRLFFERAQRRDMHRTLENLKRLLEEPETLGGRTAS